MLFHALANTFSDLATGIGLVVLGIALYFLLAAVASEVFYLLRGGREGYERREAREIDADYRDWLEQQRREEIECMGGRRHLEVRR